MASRQIEAEKQRFGPFEFDPTTFELRKNGIRIRLQTKPAQMLTALLATPGQVVGREELRQRLWPGDTFVDFESGLNTAAKRLRDALSDSADEPRYVETLPRNGYRFVANVEPITVAPVIRQELGLAPVRTPEVSRHGWMAAAAAGLLLGLIPWIASKRESAPPQFRQITFQRSPISSARFGPDGQTILYSSSGEGRQVFVNNGVSPESRALANRTGAVVSVSRRGELALLTPRGTTPLAGSALSRAPMNGGDPMELERSVMSADWAPDGAELAIARAVSGSYQLEYPRGKVLFRTAGWLSHVRVSPSGDRIAFLHHPVRHDDGGSLNVVDAAGSLKVLVKDWATFSGLAWHPQSGEIWFTGAKEGGARSIWAADLQGRLRVVLNAPGSLSLADIAANGRVLLSRDVRRLEMAVGGEGAPVSEITWYDWSRIQEISPDGSVILFDESGEGAGGRPVTFLYRTASASAVRVGDGRAMGLAADGQQVLLLDYKDRKRLTLVPLGPGSPRQLPPAGLEYQWARFLPGGQSLLALGNEKGGPLRLYRINPADGKAVAITPPTVVRNAVVSPSALEVAVLDAEGRLMLFPLSGTGPARLVPAPEPVAPLLWTAQGLVVQRARSYTEVPATLFNLDPGSGRMTPLREIGPHDTTGVNAITRVVVAEDRKHWAFNYRRVQSELFLASGLR